MNQLSEIRGTIRCAYATLIRTRQAQLEGLGDENCMPTPSDVRLMRQTWRDMKIVLRDIEKNIDLFETVSGARVAITTV